MTDFLLKYFNDIIYICLNIYIHVSVNLCNQAFRELTETFRQFVNYLKILGNLLQNTEAWPIVVCR